MMTNERGGPNADGASRQLCTAVLSIWNDIDPTIEGEYEDWYQKDHLRDRVSTPGFRSCRRYQRIRGEGREYFTFSDLDSIQAIGSSAYRERLQNATDWTRRIMPHFRRLIRVAADVTVERGDGTGGFAATALFERADSANRALVRAALGVALDGVMNDARVTRVRLFEANGEFNDLPNPEARLRPDPPRTTDLAIVVEGSSEVAVAQSLSEVLDLPALGGLVPAMPVTVYRLLYSSQN